MRVKTKIIATLGPASSSENVLRKMFINGLDLVRLNFSHGTHNEHIQRIETINRLNKKLKRKVKIMQDLEGYRIRIGKLKEPITLARNKEFYITKNNILGNIKEISFDYKGSLKKIKKETLIYIDDGKIILKVKAVQSNNLKVKVVSGGMLKSNKGINMPGLHLSFSSLTRKDKDDLEVGIRYKVDSVAQSFVRNAKDLKNLKKKLGSYKCKVFAKVENQQALKNIDEIIKEADGIIVARGDLGICVPIYKVPIIQKEIIKNCLKKNKPVVVATQMLDSMTYESLPTRAEVSDVANAILDGATHLLLSGETAVGKHPDKVINMMNEVIKNTEIYKSGKFNLK